ncbi:hypothetical protein Tco_1003819 [Tanacetum coccineum]|uniref:Tf2-1-like SH3-like domain-containing protein n=1 Tax=Tanacetum coccineum TaxID=301880 RepID=A0ABQ5FA52_9ASTR
MGTPLVYRTCLSHPETDGLKQENNTDLEDMLLRAKLKRDVRRKPMEFKVVTGITMEGHSYMLEFPEELKGIHSTFHVSNLKKYLAEGDMVLMDEIQLDDKLHMIEEPVEVVDREVKRLKQIGTYCYSVVEFVKDV